MNTFLTDGSTAGRPRSIGMTHLALAVGAFGIGIGEFTPMGLLPNIARDIGVSIPDAGHIISAYALGVVVGAPVLTVIAARAPRRALLLGLMILFAVGNLLSAFAPNDGMLIAARFVAGLPHGAFFGVAMLVAASLVRRDQRGQAVGRVLLGISVANLLGVPCATWFGQALGWRAAFGVVAGIAILDCLLLALYVPSIKASAGASPRRELGALARKQVWLTLAVASVGCGGMFSVYSYITPTLTHVTGMTEWMVPVVLSVWGLGMIAGSLIGPYFSDRALMPSIAGFLIWNILVMALFTATSAYAWSAVLTIFLIGTGVAVVPAMQTRLMDVAADAQTLAAALNHAAFNIANALGAWLGGLVIFLGYGWTAPSWVGAALAGFGLLIFCVSVALDKPEVALPAGARP
jgi:DHA1 family inner membrane transport protein